MAVRITVTFNNHESITFPDGLRAAEMELVREWTRGKYGNRQQWFEGIGSEDTDALKALLCILRRRNGDQAEFANCDFDYDALEAYFVDEDGRQIEPDMMVDDDGDPVLIIKEGREPRPRVHKNPDGSDRWVYTDTREPVPVNPTSKKPPTSATATAIPTTLGS